MTTAKQATGRWGEEVAFEFLKAKDSCVLARNVCSANGEIDIVASKDGLLVFVQVKTRRSHAFAYPEDSVTRRKQAYLISAAEEYLQAHPEGGDSWQFDVIPVEGKPGGEAQVVHFENVIESFLE